LLRQIFAALRWHDVPLFENRVRRRDSRAARPQQRQYRPRVRAGCERTADRAIAEHVARLPIISITGTYITYDTSNTRRCLSPRHVAQGVCVLGDGWGTSPPPLSPAQRVPAMARGATKRDRGSLPKTTAIPARHPWPSRWRGAGGEVDPENAYALLAACGMATIARGVRYRPPLMSRIACWWSGRTAQTIRLRSGVRGSGTPSTIVRVLTRRVVPLRCIICVS